MTSAYDQGRAPKIELRHRLMIARTEAGLSQAALADLIGVARNSIGNAETGTTTPRRITVNAWALATGVPVTWLLTGEEPAPAGPDGGVSSPPSGLNRRPSLYKGGSSEATVTDLFGDRSAVPAPARRAA